MEKTPIRTLRRAAAAAVRSYYSASAAAAAAAEGAAYHKPLYRRLSALNGVPGGSVAETMNQWIREGGLVTENRLMRIVREMRKYNNYKLALQLYDWIETRGMKMSASKYAVRLGLIANVKGIDSAESYFSSLPESGKNLQTYGALLNSYCCENKPDKAGALFQKMKELNLASVSPVYNSLMTLYLKLGQPHEVEALFQQMKANNVIPDNVSYNILIKSYGLQNDIDSVEKIIQEMVDGGVALDWPTCTNLACAYNSAGLFENAMSALKEAERLMDRCNRGTFHSLISLYADAGALAEVNRVWKSLKDRFTNATNLSYYVMLLALNRLDEMDALQQCFEEWEANCITYDMRLVNVMIGAYLRKDMVLEAESLCKKASDRGVRFDIRMIELFMDYFLKRHEMDSPEVF